MKTSFSIFLDMFSSSLAQHPPPAQVKCLHGVFWCVVCGVLIQKLNLIRYSENIKPSLELLSYRAGAYGSKGQPSSKPEPRTFRSPAFKAFVLSCTNEQGSKQKHAHTHTFIPNSLSPSYRYMPINCRLWAEAASSLSVKEIYFLFFLNRLAPSSFSRSTKFCSKRLNMLNLQRRTWG